MLTRESARAFVAHPRFNQVIIALILVNAVSLGLETSPAITATAGDLLHTVDRIALGIFVAELGLRMYARGAAFVRDPWNVFDLVVVGIALIPASGPLAVLRALRVLRVLRLVSMVPAMRRVVGGLLSAIPGMASIVALLALILYVAGVMATKLFGAIMPERFGDLGATVFTLFTMMTEGSWSDIARELSAEAPLAWVFFVVYIVVSSFAVLNLFIAVIVSGMEKEVTSEIMEAEEKQAESDQILLAEIRALRAEVAQLRTERDPA